MMLRGQSLRRPWWARMDWFLLLLSVALCVIGVYNLESATRSNIPTLVQNHIIFLGIGGVAAVCITWLDTRLLEALAYPIFGVVNFLLLLVLLFGKEVHGAQRWFEIGGIGMQPSEFAKIAGILALSRFLADRPRPEGYGFKDLVYASLIIGPTFLLIFVEPDLGTSILFLIICFSILIMARVRAEALFTYLSAVLLAVPILWAVGLIRAYQKSRVLTFLRLPGEIALLELYGGILLIFLALAAIMFGIRAYQRSQQTLVIFLFLGVLFGVGATLSLDAFYEAREAAISQEGPAQERARKLREIKEDYQPRQSEIAIGAGGLYGMGYKQGTQIQLGFLPIAWTDYIFSVYCEEHGFVGALFLISMFLALTLWALRIALSARDRFSAYVAVGCAAFYLWHMLINIGMVTRLLPVVGVTLPLFSSGGSSMTAALAALGLLMHVSVRRGPRAGSLSLY